MGPPSYMWPAVARNVVMRRIPVVNSVTNNPRAACGPPQPARVLDHCSVRKQDNIMQWFGELCKLAKYGKNYLRCSRVRAYFMSMYRTLDTLHWEEWEKYGVVSSTTRLLFPFYVVCYNKTWYKCIPESSSERN